MSFAFLTLHGPHKDAYQAAIHGNYTLIHELQELFERPYERQRQEFVDRYYRGQGDRSGLKGGVGFMS